MASSSTPSSSITTLTKKHEVFLSFRGEDTRHGFTSHLYDALCRKKIETFIDDHKLERGDEISPALLRAIEGSKIAVVIFSKNYASSKWCLRELVEIIKCKKMNKLIVMPVFYDVDPSDVRKQTGSFECSFANYEEIGRVGIFSWFSCRFKKRKEKELHEEVQKWREALTEASNLSGWDSSVIRTESKLVCDVVEGVWRKLRSEYISSSSDFEGLVGIHERIEQVMSLLCLDMEDVRKIIGIWGMGGIGKTTIAQAVFKFISNKFDGACFVEKVGKRLENGGSDHLQLEVLSKVLREENPKLDTPIRPFIMEMFNQKKVFIVLDDVNNFLQLETLVDCLRRCGLGSRIIITSRDKQAFRNFNIDDHEIYEAKGFNDREALELFRKYAKPTEDCMALSYRIVYYANGNPLAIKVLGSSLKGKSKQVWESALNNLQGIVYPEIFDVLKISYDGLNENEQSLFLDIACFESLYNKGDKYSLSVLIAKSLVTIYKEDDWVDEEEVEMHDLLQEMTIDGEEVEMHNLLQDMGREIVRRESPKIPGKRSRLWEQDDVIQILKNNTGTDAVEVISLGMDGLEAEGIDLSPQVFDNMHNLRFLLFYSYQGHYKVHLSKGLNCLPNKLMVLDWSGYPLTALPSNFNPKQLVKLDLHRSNIKQFWEGTKRTPKFPNLKWLYLRYCTYLTRIPNLSDFPILEEVDLEDCKSLVGLTSSVHQLNNLQDVNLSGCINVTKFPLISGSIERLNLTATAIEEASIQSLTNLTELNLSSCKRLKHISANICKSKSLSTLNLRDCSQLETFLEILETMESLKSLELSRSAIKVLHTSIEHLNGLQHLTLADCKNLEMLPTSICNLTSLKGLNLCNCSKLDKLPDNLGNLKSLKWLDVSGSGIGQLPSSITCLENLEFLDCSGCRGLTILPSLSGLHSLRTLHSDNCSLMEIPEDIGYLSSLKKLELSRNMFESLPKSIKQLSKLESLSLSHCKMLRSIPELPEGLKYLYAMDCDQLCQLPDAKCLKNLENLGCSGCRGLTILPSLLGLHSLQTLHSDNCNLMEIPEDIGCLSSLKELELSRNMFESLPKSIKQLSKLESLSLSHCKNLRSIPELPEGLKYLYAMDCKQLCQLPDAKCLKNLENLHCSGCSLMEIPEDIGCVSSLKKLELSRNMFESLPKSIKQLSKLESLSLSHCKNLRSIPELPEGLQCLEAMDCDQLCQVPDASEFVRCVNAKPHSSFHSVEFRFTNCLNLIKAVSNVFKESLREMQHTEKESGIPSNAFSISLPGNKIPEWFSYRSSESSSVNIQVLRNDWYNRKFMGFAICAVFGFEEYNRGFGYMPNVDCDFEIYHDHIKIGEGSQYFLIYIPSGHGVFMHSEHMLLGYCSFSSFYSSFQNPNELPISDSDCLDISIEFKYKYGGNRPKGCAVHLIYAEEPIEIIGATIQEIGETSGKRINRSDDNDEEVEPYPKRICTQAIKTLDLFH